MMNNKILVVEDSPTFMRLFKNVLSGHGYQLMFAVDGEQALKIARQQLPDLLILDIILPKKNGFQVCRQLKTAPDTENIKILMVTSKTQDSDRFWGLRQGADGYITKPFDENVLLSEIDRLMS